MSGKVFFNFICASSVVNRQSKGRAIVFFLP